MAQEELIELFAQDAKELLGDLEQALIQLEESAEDTELVHRIFRTAHTLKGNAGIVGLIEIASLTHKLESALGRIRDGVTSADEAVISGLLKAVDAVATLVGALPRELVPADIPDYDAIVAMLDGAGQPGAPSHPAPPSPAVRGTDPPPRRWEIELALNPDCLRTGHDPVLLLEELTRLGEILEVKADLDALPPFGALDPERLYLSWRLRLESTAELSAIEELLAFVPGSEGIRVQPVAADASPLATQPPTPRPPAPAEPEPPEPTRSQASPAPPMPSPPEVPPPVDRAVHAEEPQKAESVRVGVHVLDRLMTLAGEMVLTRNQLLQGTESEDAELITHASLRVDQLTAELQHAVMATRMQPIRGVLESLKRTVRDLARAQGKRVRLVIDDEDVELDKTVIEAIASPLSHLVRNAVDHGIESPRDRLLAGKPEEGTLRLHAAHRSGQVVLEVSDDGRGVELERVRQRAVATGVITTQEAATLSPRATRELVFEPGFSTASAVTQVSGRGVGLDVVRTNIRSIGGTAQLESIPGRGSTFRVKLPLTLAIIPSLLVDVEAERFAIPQFHLVELLRISASEVSQRLDRIAGVEVLRQPGALLPLVRLRDLLGIEAPSWLDPDSGERSPDLRRNIADRRAGEQVQPRQLEERRSRSDRRRSTGSAVNIAVLAAGEDRYGLIVDAFLDSAEVVVKPLGRHLGGSGCYAGATVLGDGMAALILDVMGMARAASIAEKTDTATQRARFTPARESQQELIELLLLEGHGDDLFGLPLDLVHRVERIRGESLRTVGGRRVLRISGRSIPAFSMDQVGAGAPAHEVERPHVAIFQLGGREMALLVPGVRDIVLAPAEIDMLTHVGPGISGSLMLGDDDVLLVDLRDLVLSVEPSWRDILGSKPHGADRKRLLVVEDSTFFLEHIATMLEEEGYEVAKAENGAVGLELLTRNPERWDLVVTDIEMPVMDGFEMVERIRARPELVELPIMAVTSLMGAEARQRGRDVGIDEYSIKLDREHVLERCRHLLERGRGGRAT
jgi:two-component system chemotaxis sensor kinase CheA